MQKKGEESTSRAASSTTRLITSAKTGTLNRSGSKPSRPVKRGYKTVVLYVGNWRQARRLGAVCPKKGGCA
jgi:hypothetical protein